MKRQKRSNQEKAKIVLEYLKTGATVEGYNLLRHFLARLRRKTKCYSKSIVMLSYSVMLLMAKRNNTLCILA